MPAAVLPFRAPVDQRDCQFSVLSYAAFSNPAVAIGIFLLDPASGELHFRLRSDWADLTASQIDRRPIDQRTIDGDDDDVGYLAALPSDFEMRIRELGGLAFLQNLEDTLSHSLRVSDRESVAVAHVGITLDRLFREHVDGRVQPFVTHLPLYSLQAAATKFGSEMDVELRDWVPAPSGLRLVEGMFVGQVVGRSMEPLIPDGSLCVFRSNVVGSRQGSRLLIEDRDTATEDGKFTIKEYWSVKRPLRGDAGSDPEEDTPWEHEKILLKPLNPDFEAFELDGDRFRVIGEFVQVLPD